MVVQAHLKSGGGELTRENVRLMGGAVAALRREQCAAAAEEAAIVATATRIVGEVKKKVVEEAASLVAKTSVLDDQSVRLTPDMPAQMPAARGGSEQEMGISHLEQPGVGQAWLLALGDFNLDPAQVLDEVRAAGRPRLLPAYFRQLLPADFT